MKEKNQWVIQKNIGVEEKWVQKKEELVKETKENSVKKNIRSYPE